MKDIDWKQLRLLAIGVFTVAFCGVAGGMVALWIILKLVGAMRAIFT